MKLSWQRWLALATVVIMFVTGLAIYSRLPEQVASHWDISGQADSFSSRFWGAFGIPLLSCGLYLLMLVLPVIDPKRSNIEKFRSSYDLFAAGVMLFLAYLYGLTLYYNLVRPVHFGAWLIPALSALFFIIGMTMQRAKFNYTIGIRTPWTLADQKVWTQTHGLAGDLFKLAAVFMLAGIIFANQAFWFVIGLILFVTIYCAVYSYYLYRKLNP